MLTLNLPVEMDAQLTALAEQGRVSPSELAERVIGNFVRREQQTVAAIERAREDCRSGRVVEHEAAMDEIDALIERIAARRG